MCRHDGRGGKGAWSAGPASDPGRGVEPWLHGWTIVAALLPAAAAGTFHFGLPALVVMSGAAAGCLVLQALSGRMVFRASSSSPGRAALIGLLVGMNLAPTAPAWLILAGCVIAMACGRGVRRALGFDPHPAVAALVLLLAVFPDAAMRWTEPVGLFGSASTPAPTLPLAAVEADPVAALVGRVPGGSGATSVIALALGGLFLLLRRAVRWQSPVGFLAGLAVPAAIAAAVGPGTLPGVSAHVLSGAAVLAAIFIAADPTVSPQSARGKLIHGAGCGVLTWLIRTAGDRPEGVWYAMLLMSMCVPLIDLYTGGHAEQAAGEGPDARRASSGERDV